jgi:hypothetical protein
MLIFVHDNGNLNVLAMPKCGHTAMWCYFDLVDTMRLQERTFAHWLEFQSPKVVVLRHPAHRMHSSIGLYDKMWNSQIVEYQETGIDDMLWEFKHFIDDPLEIQKWIFDQHCRPYLHIIQKRDFRIIKFEDLKHYIPRVDPGGFQINPTSKDIDPFPTNRYFKREDMLKEIELYENLLATREVITPEEWKALT